MSHVRDILFPFVIVSDIVSIEECKPQYILLQKVTEPYTLEMLSIATKECFVRSSKEQLPIFFQSGAIVPYERILRGRYTEASFAFLSIEKSDNIDGVLELPKGRCVFTYHTGDVSFHRKILRTHFRILPNPSLQYCF